MRIIKCAKKSLKLNEYTSKSKKNINIKNTQHKII